MSMEYRRLGESGLRVSVISFGTWLTVGNTVDAATATSLIARAVEHGVNLLDTADIYARGASEDALGQAIASIPRHRLVLATKCFFPMSDDPNDRGLSRKHLFESLEKSLRRLRTDYVDLYQCHRPDPEVPLAETCRAMDDLAKAGKLLYWGVSMWSAEQIAAAVALCRSAGYLQPISNQPCYNLLDRSIEAQVIPVSKANGVGQIVYSPLAQGVLTGKYRASGSHPSGSRAADPRVNQFIGRFLTPDATARVDRLAALAKEVGTTSAVLALAFCLRSSAVASVIVGATRVTQLEENLRAASFAIQPEVGARLDEIFPPTVP